MRTHALQRLIASVAVVLTIATATAQAQTPFEQDVATAINRGIAWLDSQGAFNNPSPAGDATGLVLLALLEKRASGLPTDPPQGYSGANATDQARMRRLIAYILSRIPVGTFTTSYRHGGSMMAVSLYLRTGGPDRGEHADLPAALPHTLISGLNAMVDLTASYQTALGYWCYGPQAAPHFSFQACDDSSTTQLIMAGLAAARSVYSDPAHADAARLTVINTLAAKARTAYVSGGSLALSCSAGGQLEPSERGHGYNRTGYCPSIQQTASGQWIQLVGGADLNDASVQGYLRWVRNRYRYTNINVPNLFNSWNMSHYYYLWSASKAFTFMEESGVAALPGNLSTSDLGALPAASAPAFASRELQRDPAADVRVASFGAGAAGFYSAESKRWYYDFAYTLLSQQIAQGQFNAGFFQSPQGDWGGEGRYANQAYALLVLQRSVGGGCVDTDDDGVCDSEDNCPTTPNANQLDQDGDGRGDACDNCPSVSNPNQADTNNNGIGDACEAVEVLACDADGDKDIDTNDLNVIRAGNGQVAGANDPRDGNKDGRINVADMRFCQLKCTRPGCATSSPALLFGPASSWLDPSGVATKVPVWSELVKAQSGLN
jgi:hypothetical protein